MNDCFSLFRSTQECSKKVKCVVLWVVYLRLLSNSDRGKLNGRIVKVNNQRYEKFGGFI